MPPDAPSAIHSTVWNQSSPRVYASGAAKRSFTALVRKTVMPLARSMWSGLAAVGQVAGVAESGNNVGLGGHLLVDGADPETGVGRHVAAGMVQAFRTGDGRHHVQGLGPAQP